MERKKVEEEEKDGEEEEEEEDEKEGEEKAKTGISLIHQLIRSYSKAGNEVNQPEILIE